jgi:SAM-dependent methyltransferase
MSTIEKPEDLARQRDPVPKYLDARSALANSYLLGDGLEIGPLHQPLALPAHARARYVDRMSVDDLRREYPELVDWDLTAVDVVDDGETLATIPEQSQDFVVANHFLEHTENPIGTILTHLDKLKPGGVLFYAVPDMRFTFDFRRPVTPLEHMIADYEQGPGASRAEHYEEWCRLVLDESGEVRTDASRPSEEWVRRWARHLEEIEYSIHMHTWTESDFLRLILAIRERSGEAFDLEAAARVGIEFIVVLRKQGAMPVPPWPSEAPPTRRQIWARRARKALGMARDEVRRRRATP